jgi:hypothetical protein
VDVVCDLGIFTLFEGHHDCRRLAISLLDYTLAFALQMTKERKTSVSLDE